MERKRQLLFGAICTTLAASMTSVSASELEISGFARAAGAITNIETGKYLERIDKNGDSGDTHFGLSVSKELPADMSVAGQIFASGAEGGGYEMVLDWAYATKRIGNALSMNAGKIKYPNLLVSEFVDVGIAYPWIRPPQEMYSFDVEGRPNLSLESFVGASVIYNGFAGDIEYSAQAYAGDAGLEAGQLSKMMGAKLVAGTDMFSVQAGLNKHMPENTLGEGGLPADKNGKDITVITVGATVHAANVLLMSEYASGTATVEAGEESLDTSAYYATLGYQLGKILPHVTYAKLDAEDGQSSMTYGMKYQLSPAATVKMDFSQITPDAEPGMAAEDFGVLSVALDLVF